MANVLKELIVSFDADASPVLNALKNIDSRLNLTARRLNATSESFARMGKRLTLTTSVPLLGLGVASVSAESKMQSLRATLSSVLERFNTGLPIQQAVSNEIQNMVDLSSQLGISFQDMSKPYVAYMAASKDSLETNRKVIKSFLSLSSALGLTGGDVNRMIRALEQMQSKGLIMSEELKLQLGDVVPGAVSLFAEALNVTTQDLMKMMQNGEVSASVLSQVADVIDKKYVAAVVDGSKRIGASGQRLKTQFFLFRELIGSTADRIFGINDKLSGFAKWLEKLTYNFRRLNDSGKKVILVTALIIGALGPLLLLLAGVTKVFALLAIGARILGRPLFLIVEGFELLRAAVETNPLFLFLTATMLIIHYWKDIVQLFKDAVHWIGKLNIVDRVAKYFGFRKKKPNSEDATSLEDNKQKSTSISSLKDQMLTPMSTLSPTQQMLKPSVITNNSNSVMNKGKNINNNQKYNITMNMNGVKSDDAMAIKKTLKDLLDSNARQNYMELATQ